MLKSMTGFGKAFAVAGNRKLSVEVRSVNHRFCETVFRLPRQYNGFEDKIRTLINRRFARGRFEVHVNLDWEGSRETRVTVDTQLALTYYESLKELTLLLGLPSPPRLEHIIQLPQIVKLEEETEDLELAEEVLEAALTEALDALLAMRVTEGRHLNADINEHLLRIEDLISVIEERAPQALETGSQRLRLRLNEYVASECFEDARLAQEIAILADKLCISEELTRLKSHVGKFRDILQSPLEVGRKLEFLVQEMHREINTIGSKGNDAIIAHSVVDAKAELEKIREQVQNVE